MTTFMTRVLRRFRRALRHRQDAPRLSAALA
jgi:hypothetical protein